MADWLTDLQKIGIGLTACGVVFLMLGVLLFFDTGLLAMGNVLFIAGVVMVIGFQKAYFFFFQLRKWKGTSTFFVGILMVFFKWPVTGMLIEFFGFINLFGDFFPTVIRFLRSLPIIGRIFELPLIKTWVDSYLGGKLPI